MNGTGFYDQHFSGGELFRIGFARLLHNHIWRLPAGVGIGLWVWFALNKDELEISTGTSWLLICVAIVCAWGIAGRLEDFARLLLGRWDWQYFKRTGTTPAMLALIQDIRTITQSEEFELLSFREQRAAVAGAYINRGLYAELPYRVGWLLQQNDIEFEDGHIVDDVMFWFPSKDIKDLLYLDSESTRRMINFYSDH